MAETRIHGGVSDAIPHDSARKHVAGEAVYTDDIPELPGTLHAYVLMSPRAHARIVSIDTTAVAAFPGVAAVVSAADIPGRNDVGPIFPNEPILAAGVVEYIGQPVLAVAATSIKIARAAAQRARIDYEDLPAVLSIEAALDAKSFVAPPHEMKRGDATRALGRAPHRLKGEFRIGGQDHFYLEGGSFLSRRPDRDGRAAGGRRHAGPLLHPAPERGAEDDGAAS
jgi:xanthine dehydrogenase large subunit